MSQSTVMDQTKRIDLLREMALSKSHMSYVKREMLAATDEGRDTHTIADRARDFEKYLQESVPFIQDWEIIVGGCSLIPTDESTINPGVADTIHNTPDYASVLRMGFGGIREKARSLLAETTNKDKQDYYRAVDISYAAASEFVRGYAELAETMAAMESDAQRGEELLEVSRICSAIATEPATSFREALQLLWFAALLTGVVAGRARGKGPIGRLDQFLYPFYQKDIQNGAITKEQAQELIECLWVKFNMRNWQTDWRIYDSGNNIILGGVTSDGRDATNELTYMCLDATARVQLVEPKINVRVHAGTSRRLLEESCRVVRMGLGLLSFYNDRNAIPALMSTGISLEDARDYTNDGCTEIYVPGKSDLSFYLCPMLQESHDFLINNDMENYGTFDEFLTAYKKHFASLFKKNCIPIAVGSQSRSYSAFFSAMFNNCLERGIPDLKGGAIYNVRGVVLKSIVNCVDALAAIKKFVYDERTVSWEELLSALKADFEGHETLRQKLRNDSPKFGNDEDYVDLIATDLVDFLCDEAARYEIGTGLNYAVGLMTWLDQGVEHRTPSADGRRSGDLIGSNFSPSPGRDKKGPTAIIHSVNKIDTAKAGHGAVLDLKFHPSALAEDGLEKLVFFVDSAMKGDHIITLQINVVDRETLLKAKEKPEEYRDLLVRVRGFSAYFVDIDPWLQDQIIERTELNL